MTDDAARDLLAAIDELRGELRRLKRDGIVVRLSDPERDEIARRVFDLLDQRLAPADTAADDAPRQTGRRRLGKFA